MSRITSAHWNATVDQEAKVLFEFIESQMKAEKREFGHDCGHQFTISVTSRGHYGIGEPGKDCVDADYDSKPMTLTVRANSLRDALLRAASHQLVDWSGLE